VRVEDRDGGRVMFILVKYNIIGENTFENQVVMAQPTEVEIEVA